MLYGHDPPGFQVFQVYIRIQVCLGNYPGQCGLLNSQFTAGLGELGILQRGLPLGFQIRQLDLQLHRTFDAVHLNELFLSIDGFLGA